MAGRDPSRRRFVQGLALGGAAAGLGLLRTADAWAVGADAATAGHAARAQRHRFRAGDRRVAGQLHRRAAPGHHRQRQRARADPALEGRRTVTLRVTNRLRVPTSIHWHGILLPFRDGRRAGPQLRRHRAGRDLRLPLPGAPVAAPTGTTRTRGFQEQTGLYGADRDRAGRRRAPSEPTATTW